MKYRSCHAAFEAGIRSRTAYPLSAGLYKLRESKELIARSGKEIIRISEVIKKIRHPAELMHCTLGDKAIWLRDVPLNVAYRMGYEIIPGLRALVLEGVLPVQAESAARLIESVMGQRLARWDALRNSYSRKIAHEYARMRNGQSNALLVVDDALNLINASALGLPLHIQQSM